MNLSPEEFIRFGSDLGFHQFPVRCQCGKVFNGSMTSAMERGIMRGMTLQEAVAKLRMSNDRRKYFIEGDKDYNSNLQIALERICCRTSMIAVEIHTFSDSVSHNAQYDDPYKQNDEDYNDFGGFPPELANLGEPLEPTPKITTPQIQMDYLKRVSLLVEPGIEDFPLPIKWDIGDEISVFYTD